MDNLLSQEEIYGIILEILSGERVLYVDFLNEPIIFTYPNSSDKLYSNFLEKSLTEQYIKEGYIPERDITKSLIDQFFSIEDADRLIEISSKLKSYETLLRKRVKNSPQYIEDIIKINNLKEEQTLLFNKKNEINRFTAEYKAREEKYFFIMSKYTLTLDRKRKWDSVDDILAMPSLQDVYWLLNQYLDFYLGHGNTILRQVARSHQWRNYYLAATRGIVDLFSKDTKDMSNNQLELIAWSSWYNDIYDMTLDSRPEESIIEDDVRLDKYIDEYTKKLYAEARLSRNSKPGSAFDADQVIITAESNNYINLHKDKAYSDPSIISGKGQNKTSYIEKGSK